MWCNGLDTDEIAVFGRQLTEDPGSGAIRLRTGTRWRHGYAVDAAEGAIEVAGAHFPRTPAVVSDRPAVFGGGDTGPAPGELLLTALAACVTGQFIEHAALRGCVVDELAVVCEGDLDARGVLAPAEVRPGLSAVRITLEVATDDADEAALEALLTEAVRTSPVADTLAAGVALTPGVRATAPEAA